MRVAILWTIAIGLWTLVAYAAANDETHTYTDSEEVVLWTNKIGPYHNPQETYAFYSLPFCRPNIVKTLHRKHDGLGSVLEGNELTDSGFLIKFKVELQNAASLYCALSYCLVPSQIARYQPPAAGMVLPPVPVRDSTLHWHSSATALPENQPKTVVCTLQMTDAIVRAFTNAVQRHYWYQMYIDDLPLWGMVGELMTAQSQVPVPAGSPAAIEQAFVYTDRAFTIDYNGNQIVSVSLHSSEPRPVVAAGGGSSIGSSESLTFTFSVNWRPSDASFEHRFDRYLDFDFFEANIHFFAVFNSLMMVVFLCGVVTLVLMRTLKQDTIRYNAEVDESGVGGGSGGDAIADMDMRMLDEQSGWKQVHGDVYRPPPYLPLFSALIGTGSQLFSLLFLLVVGTFLSAYLDDHYLHQRGLILNSIVALYCATSLISGYISGSYYKRNGGDDWKLTLFLTALSFPGVAFGTAFLLNFIAIGYRSQIAMPFTSMITIALIWLAISCPLVIIGTMIGRACAKQNDFPSRINSLRRPIPEDGPFYLKPSALALIAGVLPFSSIFIEMYFIFTSFFNYKFYYVWGFLFVVCVILVLVTVCVTIVSTYFLLNAEDYRWQWTAFGGGAATALYVYAYASFYFITKTQMSGLLQTAFFFGYMGVFSYGLALLCGTIAYAGAHVFVRMIFGGIKAE